MRKFSRLIGLLLLIYLLLAVGILILNLQMDITGGNQYKVEINRIYSELAAKGSFTEPDLSACYYVKDVEFLSVDEKDQIKQNEFYKTSGGEHMEVKPFYGKGRLQGYLRFDYIIRQEKYVSILLAEIGLFLFVLINIMTLIYIRQQILKPFHQLSEFPYELSKGHLHEELKETKNRYFGKFVWGLGLLRDKLNVTRDRELELERQKKLMLLSLSHDIKTPLSTIKLYSNALAGDIFDSEERRRKAARQISERTVEIEQYVNEIIKASSEDILEVEVNNREFYLKDLMDKVVSTYGEKSGLQQIAFQVGPYDNKLLQGDIERAYEVIENILENAFKYGDGRKISISFQEEEYCQLIRVHNTGDPIKENEFNHLFDSFFRGSNSVGKAGNGLGLYISRKIMAKMDGGIFAEKETDGMSFTLVLKETV